MKKQIPNLITLCNLLCGVLACMMALLGTTPDPTTNPVFDASIGIAIAAFFIVSGIFFDFFDGLTARALKVPSPLGKELDSLADVVTSGVAPGLILWVYLNRVCQLETLAFVALLIPLFSAYRLAKFNIDTRQSHSFVGLPTPANALIWVSLAFWNLSCLCGETLFPHIVINIGNTATAGYIVAGLSILLNILLVCELPMFSLKIRNLTWKDNKLRYIFIIGCIALIVLFGAIGIAFSILWYIVLSILTQKKGAENE